MAETTEALAADRPPAPRPLSDAYPVLLGPLRVEYRFTPAELLVRVFPDEWAVDSFEERCTPREHEHGRRYWRRCREAGGDDEERLAAWRDLASHVGHGRAAHIADVCRPRDPASKDMPKHSERDTKPSTWTQAARARLLPDRLTLLGYAGGQPVLNLTGNPIPDDLNVGPDPGTPDSEQFSSMGAKLRVPKPLKWLVDFDTAVSVGMGFRVPLTDGIRAGLDRLIVLGLRVREPMQSKAELETLIAHQANSRAGFRLLAQGTPTNNTGRAPAAFGSGDETAERFAAVSSPLPEVPAGAWSDKTDGQWLAELLGVDPDVLATVPGADGSDQSEARSMNTALWPATWGYQLGAMFNPIFGTAALDATRAFFIRHVSGRGPVPSVRVGRQPYGVLVTTAFSRLAWEDTDADAAHRRRLNAVLSVAGQDWAEMAAQVPFLGADGDPHGLLLGMLGLHATSAEFHQRYGQSLEDYFNRLNLAGAGGSVLQALDTLGARQRVRDLLTHLGYPAGAPEPDLATRLFVRRQHPMRGPLIDDRPLSETDAVRVYTDDGMNYLGWLDANMRTDVDVVRLESGFTGGRPPGAILYLLLRHAVLNGYAEAALRLVAAAHAMSEADVVRARRELPFVHVSERTQATESRYARLYAPDPAVTGDPQRLLGDHIATIIGQHPATEELAEQADAIARLASVPTARLERTLVEHLDCCAYRLDAWRLGLATEKLFALRFPAAAAPVKGLHIGAFGWLEDVRPRATQPTPVTLTGELAQVFTPPGAPPLVHDPANQGYVHAPSLTQATTAALLRTGYLADASPGNPGTLAVNLSSERVRIALTFLDGIRAGQSLGALLGYRLERGMHDRHDVAETDRFITALRGAFPLVAEKLPATAPPPGTAVESLEARNVVDGLALVRHVTRTGPASYPFGRSGLPAAGAEQAAAIDAEVQALVEIHDALADLAVAEGVHQAVLGNPDRAAATMDAYTKTGFPPDPDVVRTPRSGQRLNHRFGLHLREGLSPKASPVQGVPMTPRGSGDPAVNQWLADLLPPPREVACKVVWSDPVTKTTRSRVVTQAEIGLQPIDLLWVLRPDDRTAMTELDDRIIGRVLDEERLRGDTELVILYTDRSDGKVSLFELSPLIAALRTLLLGARPAKPSDFTAPAGGGELDPQADDDVDLPRNRPQAVRDALIAFGTSLSDFVGDLSAPLADPVARRGQLLSGVDGFLTRYADLLLTAGGLGLVRSGWGELVMWRRGRFADVLAAVQVTADRMSASLAEAVALIAEYDALPPGAPEQRFALLQQAERLLTTAPTSPRPGTPQQLRAIVGNRRTAFTNRLSALTAVARTSRTTLSGLLSDVSALLPLTQFDRAGLDLTPIGDAVVAFCADLLARAQDLQREVTHRLAEVAAALADYDQAPPGPGRVAAATAAIRAALGPDALATSEFEIPRGLGQEWQRALTASRTGKLTQHLRRDFPVDDWLHGLARVRPRLALWERIGLLAGAIGQDEPDLLPIQLPYEDRDPWLGLELPAGFELSGDRLLYTAHYAASFEPGDDQCALLIDEWTETIPATTATTGIAAHYDGPGSQPPQSMLLVAPPARTGAWRWDDLVAAVTETLDLIRTRAVEPAQLDRTVYAQLLPATAMAATARAITITTDLSANNELPPADGPFRPARG